MIYNTPPFPLNDGFTLQVWDLDTGTCLQTIVGHRCEIWSLLKIERLEGGVVFLTGAADEYIRGYKLGNESESAKAASSRSESSDEIKEDSSNVLFYFGSLIRTMDPSQDNCTGLFLDPSGTIVAAQTSGKSIEVVYSSIMNVSRNVK